QQLKQLWRNGLGVGRNAGGHNDFAGLRIEAAARIENPLEERIDLVAQADVECETGQHPEVVIDVPALEIVVVALECLERASGRVVGIAEEQIAEGIAGI